MGEQLYSRRLQLLLEVGTMIIKSIRTIKDETLQLSSTIDKTSIIAKYFTENDARRLQIAASPTTIGWRKYLTTCYIIPTAEEIQDAEEKQKADKNDNQRD